MKVRGWIEAGLAFLTAAAAGAAVVTMEFVIHTLTTSDATGLYWGWRTPMIVWLCALAVFLAGLLFIGTPVWLLMAGLGRNSRVVATGVGAILAAAAGFAIAQLNAVTTWSWDPIVVAALLVLPGAAAGWTLHRVAYGKTAA